METFFKWDTPTRTDEQKREQRRWEKARQHARYEAFKHFEGCCARCGRPLVLKPSSARHEFEIANAHEEPPRSLGGDPTNPRHLVILCTAPCHKRVTEKKTRIILRRPELGTFGGLTFIDRPPGGWNLAE